MPVRTYRLMSNSTEYKTPLFCAEFKGQALHCVTRYIKRSEQKRLFLAKLTLIDLRNTIRTKVFNLKLKLLLVETGDISSLF